jgi:hypothetical protein
MPTWYRPRAATPSAIRRFQLPSRSELPLLTQATVCPRGSAWSKPATSTARIPLVPAHVCWFSCRGSSLAWAASTSRRFVLYCFSSSHLLVLLSPCLLYLSRVPFTAFRSYLSWPSSSHHSPILRCLRTNIMRFIWASRQSWILSRTNASSM